MSLQPGDVLHERYRIEGQLGKGGMGAVFLAHDITLDIKVAVKENLNISPESERQFLREARLLAGLRHPNLPRVTDHFILEDRQYLVMDYIEGVDLHERAAEQRPTVDEVVGWADAIADALIFLHTRHPPIIHRDIKPANLKLQNDGNVVLVDFGIAKVFDQSQTTTGARGLTPGFSPPEQYGGQRTDERSDQYALAATLYLLLTNKRPADSIQRSLGKESLTPIRQLSPGVPEHVEAAIERGLALDQNHRFTDIKSFRAALDGELALETIRAPIATITAPKSNRRGLWMGIGVGAGLIVIAALACGLSGGFGGLFSGDRVATPTSRPAIEPEGATSTITPTLTPPTEEPEESPTPNPEAEAVALLTELSQAHADGDSALLYARLHGEVIERYGASQCQLYLEGVTGSISDLEALSTTFPVVFHYSMDDMETVLPDAVRLNIRYQAQDQTFETEMHMVEENGEIRWFTDCGEPLSE
jgi:serine/threonine-protein kinase